VWQGYGSQLERGVNGDLGLGEEDNAPYIAELATRQQGMGLEIWQDVHFACLGRQQRNRNFTFMRGMHDGSIRFPNGERAGGDTAVHHR
jgi:hypothetical protein